MTDVELCEGSRMGILIVGYLNWCAVDPNIWSTQFQAWLDLALEWHLMRRGTPRSTQEPGLFQVGDTLRIRGDLYRVTGVS